MKPRMFAGFAGILMNIFCLYPQDSPVDSLLRVLPSLSGTSRIDCCNELAFSYSFISFTRSLKFAELAYQESGNLGYRKGIADALNRMAKVYSDIGMKEEALQCLREAFLIKERECDKNEIARSFHMLGFLFFEMNLPDSALWYHRKSASVYKSIRDYYFLGNSYFNLSVVFREMLETDSSLVYLQLADSSYEQASFLPGQVRSRYTAGKIVYAQKKFEAARRYYLSALSLADGRPEIPGIAYVQLQMGNLENMLGNTREAGRWLRLTLDNPELPDTVRMNASHALYQIEKREKNFREAHRLLNEHLATRDTVKKRLHEREIDKLSVKYDLVGKADSIQMMKKAQLIEELRVKRNDSLWKYYLSISMILLVTIFIGIYFFHVRTKVNNKLTVKNDDLAEINEALRASEAELQEVNATKNKFFSVLAHDLVNPFNALLNFTELLLFEIQKNSQAKLKEYSAIIYQTSKNLNALLENLLEWTRTQQSKIDHHPEILELARFSTAAISLLKIAAEKKGIELEIKVPYDIRVYADANMLSMVLRNVVQNAIKFTFPGGKVSLDAKILDENVVISVKDNGVGIKKDRLDDLFNIEKHMTTKGTANEGGTGLGLILCKEFVERNNGLIWVESTENKGTTFFFTVPQKRKKD